MKLASLTVVAALALLAAPRPVRAQQSPSPNGALLQPARAADPLMGSLFPPEAIMQNQDALGLTDQQQQSIVAEIQRTQTQATAIQWRLLGAMQRLADAVKTDHPDESRVLAQLDSVLAMEREMKRAQMTLLVRLKDALTPEQQATLRGRMTPAAAPRDD